MRTYHLRFVMSNGDERYTPAYKAEVVLGVTMNWIDGFLVSREQAESAALSLTRSHSLPALGVWDCTLPEGGCDESET